MSSTRNYSVSLFLILPCLWILNTKTRFLADWDPNAILNTRLEQVKFLILFFLGVYCLWHRKIDWSTIIKENIILILFILYMGISITWSDYPGTAFKRYFKTIGMAIMVLIIITDKNPSRAISFVLSKTYGLIAIISIILIYFFPNYGIFREEWTGLAYDKNGLGQCFCVGSIVYLWKVLTPENRFNIIDVGLFIFITFFVFFGIKSTTSIVVILLAASILVFLFLKINKEHAVGLLFFSLAFAGLFYSYYSNLSLESPLVTFVKYLGKDMSFTGRDELWRDVMKLANKRPWLGYGYDSVWIGNVMGLWDKHGWNPNQAHSGYIDTYFTLGIIGILFLITVIGFSFINIIFQFPISYDLCRIRIALLAALLLFNKTESSFVTSYQDLWLIFLLVASNRNEQVNIHMETDEEAIPTAHEHNQALYNRL